MQWSIPGSRPATSRHDTLKARMLDDVNYDTFQAKCRVLAGLVDEAFVVHAILSWTVAWAWHLADPALVADTRRRQDDLVANITKKLGEEKDPERQETLTRALSLGRRQIAELPERQARGRLLYKRLCESILQRLSLEDPLVTVLTREV